MHPKNIYATRTALAEWAGQGCVNKADGVALDPRLETFGASTRLTIEVARYGTSLATFYAYATKALQDADPREVNAGAIVYADATLANNKLSFSTGGAWVADALVISIAMRSALVAFAAALVIADGVPVDGQPGTNNFGDLVDVPNTLTGYGVTLAAEEVELTGGGNTTVKAAFDKAMAALQPDNGIFRIPKFTTAGTTFIPLSVSLVYAEAYGDVPGEGGDYYERVAAMPAHSMRFSNGGWWRLQAKRPTMNGASFGISSSNADNASRVIVAAAYAAAMKVPFINIDDPIAVTTPVAPHLVGDVTFCGEGSIPLYRKSVIRQRGSNFNPPQTLVLERDMPNFCASPNPVVVAAGDSLMTYRPTNVAGTNYFFDETGSLMRRLERELKEGNTEKTITFINRAIGAQRYFDFNGVAVPSPGIGLPDFYNDTLKAWLAYIEELAPDSLFLNFGMNDGRAEWNSGNHPVDIILKVIQKIRGWKKVPDIILCTNIVPSSSTTETLFSSKEAQEGRDAIAGITRSIATIYGLGYLDFNRHFNVTRDGRDILSPSFELGTVGTVQTIPFDAPDEVRDYLIEAEFTNIVAGFWDPSGTSVQPLFFPLSPRTGNIAVINDIGGFLRIEIFRETGKRFYSRVTTIATPATGSNVKFMVRLTGNYLVITVNDNGLYDGLVYRFGGVFQSRFAYSQNPTGMTGTFRYLKGVERQYLPVARDSEIYNEAEGGNDTNHPCMRGAELCFSPVLSGQNWRATRPSVAAPGSIAEKLLPFKFGAAFDFARRDYFIRQTNNTKTSGDPGSLVVTTAGAVDWPLDPISGDPYGLRIPTSAAAHILLSGLPFSSTEGTLIVDAMTDANNGVVAGLGPDANNGPRIQLWSSGANNPTITVFDNTNTNIASGSQADVPGGIFNRWVATWKDNDVEFVTNGQFTFSDLIGSIPTGLTRLKLGHVAGAAPSAVTIRKLVYVPKKLSQLHALRISL